MMLKIYKNLRITQGVNIINVLRKILEGLDNCIESLLNNGFFESFSGQNIQQLR